MLRCLLFYCFAYFLQYVSLQLSWTFEKEGTKLEWRWKCQPAPNSKETTAGILDFLMDANIRLSVRLHIFVLLLYAILQCYFHLIVLNIWGLLSC